ncbi:hypothetical protein [Xenorhabdus anantnagensis]|uniref:Uncharacterized protein n=1 Tax=Xenorhabdus anantnagensis TaxID=3025875 RepID=A0ABT5LZ42_9GAMM|nr:hypothetical protein [Xenorhabdus anantnagensis]MDC9599013.1 hypothetical protein [Xenorhabdus anantnagensis]
MINEFKNNTVDDIASRLKVAANVAKTYSGNEITVNCDELLKLCEAAKKLAEYENMELVGHFYRSGDGFIGEVLDKYKDAFPLYLYRHPII